MSRMARRECAAARRRRMISAPAEASGLMVSTFFFSTRLASRDGHHFRSRGSAAGRMSETAEERKKRLRAMRDEAEKTEPELKFRNYLPRDEALQEGQVRARERALEMRPLPKAAAVDLATLATSPDEPIPTPTAQIKARQAPDFEAPVVEKEPEEEDEVRPSSQTTFARAETPLAAFTRRHLTLDVPPPRADGRVERDAEEGQLRPQTRRREEDGATGTQDAARDDRAHARGGGASRRRGPGWKMTMDANHRRALAAPARGFAGARSRRV